MADLKTLKFKPWNRGTADFPPDLYRTRGMIAAEERQCFYHLARHYLTGAGYMVDAGCFVGSSTFAFAAGASDAGRRQFDGKPILHAYDYFEVIDEYVGAAIERMFGRSAPHGSSYLDLFRQQLAPYLDMVDTHTGDFHSHRWNGGPIEILFIDIAKALSLNKHLVSEFFPALIPGKSIVVQQDYYHCWHPFIHVTMEYLADEFELVDEFVHGSSRLWRLARPIPSEKLQRLKTYSFSGEETDAMLKQLAERSSYEMRPMMEVVRLTNLLNAARLDGAVDQVERIKDLYQPDTSINIWAQQFRAVEQKVRAATEKAGFVPKGAGAQDAGLPRGGGSRIS